MKNGAGYWRIMADLNPSLINESHLDKKVFSATLKEASGIFYEAGAAQGDRYFNIPVLNRHRGVSHYYLEGYNSGNFEKDKNFAKNIGEAVIDKYIGIVSAKLATHKTFTQKVKAEQLDYHTLYLFQVLTLDRGTTSGLLVHDQNDVGIMGSIPSHVNRELLETWVEKMPEPQDLLVKALLKALPDEMPTPVNEKTKKSLAKAVRKHYKQYPEALKLQASGEIIPTTVDNHIAKV